jgi:hypothetical protein
MSRVIFILNPRANYGTLAVNDRPYQKAARAVLHKCRGPQSGAGLDPVVPPARPPCDQAKDIQRIEFEWPLGRPHCAPLGRGLWEVRSNLSGDRIARVIFCMGNGHMVLLHGFIKKSQKTPQPDLALALKRMKELQ